MGRYRAPDMPSTASWKPPAALFPGDLGEMAGRMPKLIIILISGSRAEGSFWGGLGPAPRVRAYLLGLIFDF